MSTYPEQLFELLDEGVLQDLIAQRQEENLHLDFKRAQSLFSSNDRRNLAVALSGFANADGGVIVWGVGTTRVQGVEHASEVNSISPLSQFVSHLNEFTGQAVNPLVDRVRHKRIELGPDSGIAVTLVPSSDGGPHMAKLSEDRYYKRSGSRFAKMEHYEVADMFGRRQRPDLRLTYRIQGTDVGAPRGRIARIALRLENHGRGSARAPFLDISPPPDYSVGAAGGVYGRPGEALIRIVPNDSLGMASNRVRFVGYADFIIHPGTGYDIAMLAPNQSTVNLPDVLAIDCTLTAENCPLNSVQLRISREEILRAL